MYLCGRYLTPDTVEYLVGHDGDCKYWLKVTKTFENFSRSKACCCCFAVGI